MVQVPSDVLQEGDVVALRPGDRASVDGVVVDGTSTVDEAALTGEPLPVKKIKGDAGCEESLSILLDADISVALHLWLYASGRSGAEIMAGTVNVDGTIMVQAKACGADTAIADVVRTHCLISFAPLRETRGLCVPRSHMTGCIFWPQVRLVEEAQARTAPVQRLADKVSGVFAYGVMGASLATFAFWATVGTKVFPQVLSGEAQERHRCLSHAPDDIPMRRQARPWGTSLAYGPCGFPNSQPSSEPLLQPKGERLLPQPSVPSCSSASSSPATSSWSPAPAPSGSPRRLPSLSAPQLPPSRCPSASPPTPSSSRCSPSCLSLERSLTNLW